MKNTHTFIQKSQGLLLCSYVWLLPNLLRNQNSFNDQYGSPVVPEITFDKSLLEPDGTFTEKSLPKFLAKAYERKKTSQ